MSLTIETSNGPRVFDGDGPIRIGRDPSAEMVVDNPNVSRFHAELRIEDGGWTLHDTNSTQGVYVGGQRVTRLELDGRTVVRLGRTDDAEQITVDAPQRASSDAATRLPTPPPDPTIVGVAEQQRPGGALRDSDVAGGTVVTGHTINVQSGGRNYSFEPGRPVVIGRDDDCEVVADNPTVSRRHAELRHDGTHWHLVDLGSSRGTFVDGKNVDDLEIQGSQAAWLGDPEAGERVVLVASGERLPTVTSGSAASGRNAKIAAGVGAVVIIAAIALGVVLFRGGNDGPSNNELASATVRISAGSSYGSGVIINADKGLILTNAHVGDDHAAGLAVQYPREFDDFDSTPAELAVSVSPGLDRAAEPRYRAIVVASDGYLDIAVLKITKTAAGAFIGPDDLKGLSEVDLGSSSSVKSGDQIRIIGYPQSSASRNPTITTGIIASEVQDERLNTNRAWFNETAGSSGGNSGGGVLDNAGRIVSVLTQGTSGQSATPGRSRPIDLARNVIDAAEKGTPYTSPFVTPLPKTAAVVKAHAVSAATQPGFARGCNSRAASPRVGDDAVAIQVQYEGFTADTHQDTLIQIIDVDNQTIAGAVDTNSSYPFMWDKDGCVTVSVPLQRALNSSSSYRARILIGPKYDKGVVLRFSFSSRNDTDNTNNDVTPPPSG